MQKLSADTPKQNPWRDDRLGYAPFSKRLADTILNLRAPEGFVIGLSGPWGSGKTTALNFAKAHIEKHNQETTKSSDKVLVVDFEPWLFSGHTDLISAFFQVLAESLPDKGDQSRWTKPLGKFARTNSDSLSKLVAAVGTAVDPTSGILATAGTQMAKATFDARLDRWLEVPSLQKAYSDLVRRLRDKPKRILVVIDDLDRLSKEEIRSMMQMVKSVGRLPHVTYLLSYDRRHVWSALDDLADTSSAEPSFAEKIIQQELSLPKPSKSALLSMLDEKTAFVIRSIEEDERWYQIVLLGIRNWIDTPRDIVRFANALTFIWPAVQGEVDAADVVAMEGMRLFAEPVFKWIQANSDFVVPDEHIPFQTDEEKNAVGESFRSLVYDKSIPAMIELVCELFPQRAKYLSESQHRIHEEHYRVVRRRGIGYAEGYRTYMMHTLSQGTISTVAINEVLQRLDNEDWLKTEFSDWCLRSEEGLIPGLSELLSELHFRFIEPSDLEPTQELLTALCSIGNRVSQLREIRRAFTFDTASSLQSLISKVLQRVGPETARDMLCVAFSEGEDTSYALRLFVRYGHYLGKFGDDSARAECPVTDEGWVMFGSAIRPFFEADIEKNQHLKYPTIWSAIRAHTYFFGSHSTKTWVIQSASQSTNFLYGAASALLTTTTGADGITYGVKDEPDLEVYDVMKLHALATEAISKDVFSGEDAKKMRAFTNDAMRWFDKSS